MGETDDHRDEMKDYAINVLKDFFAADPNVYVSGNNLLYYTEGVPADCVSPDPYVVSGGANRQRADSAESELRRLKAEVERLRRDAKGQA